MSVHSRPHAESACYFVYNSGRFNLMAKNFRELEAKMDPKLVARAKAEARKMLADMELAELREAEGFTQEELAAKLGIQQPTLSRMESQSDMQVSTLRRIVEALGGKLEIIAHLPTGDVTIKQFPDAA